MQYLECSVRAIGKEIYQPLCSELLLLIKPVAGAVNAILDTFIMFVLHNVGGSITLSHA